MHSRILEMLARQSLKALLYQLPTENQKVFKKMYAPHAQNAAIGDVVDSMPVVHLDWALRQVENTIMDVKTGA